MQREAITYGLNDTGALIVQNRNGVHETIFAETIRISAHAQNNKL
jgi:hypothetical protein